MSIPYYAYDTYPSDIFERVIESLGEFMVSKPGFTRFREFNSALLNLYIHKKDGQKVADLYPDIISWMESIRRITENRTQP